MRRVCYLWLTLAMTTGCNENVKTPATPAAQPKAAANSSDTSNEIDQAAKTPEQKDIITLTPQAAEKMKQFMQQRQDAKFIRVGISDDFEYQLAADHDFDAANDYLGLSHGVPILVDRESSLRFRPNTMIDFQGQGFKFTVDTTKEEPLDTSLTLAEARQGFKSKLIRQETSGEPLAMPPTDEFRFVQYDSAPGKLAAYVTSDPQDGKRHPAIIWITGGDCNTLANVWEDLPANNDQFASAYRKAGIVLMFPSLRGGNENPGVKEGFFGEVDDVIAAADFLSQQSYVDPDRIYLGGHSTGGTLALLTAEISDRFRAVFSFGPAHDVAGYGGKYCTFVLSDVKESHLRAPGRWLHSIHVPVFVFEGADGSAESLQIMARTSTNPLVHFFEVSGANHFDVLDPTNRLIAEKILYDTEPTCKLAFTLKEVNEQFAESIQLGTAVPAQTTGNP